MMKSMYLMRLKHSGLHPHTMAIAHRVILLLSLFLLSLGNVCGQEYEEKVLIDSRVQGSPGSTNIYFTDLNQYEDSYKVHFYYESNYTGTLPAGYGITLFKDFGVGFNNDWNSSYVIRTSSDRYNGEKYEEVKTIGEIKRLAEQATGRSLGNTGIAVYVWNSILIKATVEVPILDPFLNTARTPLLGEGFDSEEKDVNIDSYGSFSLIKIKDKIPTLPDNIKYARIYVTKDGRKIEYNTNINSKNLLEVTGGQQAGESEKNGLYVYNGGDNLNLNAINVTLNAGTGNLDKYKIVVLLSTGTITDVNGAPKEPQWEYEYTHSFTYPVKTKYKTLIINSTNAPAVYPLLIRNWLELAGDCGVNKQAMDKLIVRWYLEDDKGNEIEISGFECEYSVKITSNEAKGWYKTGFESGRLDDQGKNARDGYYNDKITLWSGTRSDYKNIRLVCVASTKTDNYTPNADNWQDPEIQVKYVYTLILNSEINAHVFTHYQGEAYRYLKKTGDDEQANEYDFITDGIGSTTAPVWNVETYDYDNVNKAVRQNVHTVDYYYYVIPGQTKELLLPLQDYATGGSSSTEPMAYFRWYDYQTDRTSLNLKDYGSKLNQIGDYGYFALYDDTNNGQNNNKIGEPNKDKIGATFQAPGDFSGEIQIACDVSRYMDGMDESFRYLVHEPTLSIRYLFHIRPASRIAEDILKARSLSNVESDIMDPNKVKPSSILEDEGRTVVSTNDGYGEFALRTKLSSLDNYYYYYKNDKNDLREVHSLWWYAYYYDGTNWWRHLIENKPYLDRDGRPSYRQWWGNNNPNPSTAIYRTQSHQAKYSLADKKWPDYDESTTDGDFKGTWQKRNDSRWETTEADKPNIGVGDRVQMVACVDYNPVSQANAQPSDEEEIMPIIWTELEFIDAKPLVLSDILQLQDTDKDYERTAVYMNDHYGDENKKPKALLDFNEFSLLGMRKPTHSYENYATVPLHYPNAQYGFIYPQLYGYCATQRDNGIFGMAPMHGDYTLLKSMNMPGISMDKEANNPGAQSIQVNWVTIPDVSNNYPLFDVSYERKNGKNTSSDDDDYGGFLYVDAADEARTIATLEFDAKLCEDAKIYYTAYVASMTGRTQSKEANGGSTGWNSSAENSSPQTAPSLRFRVSALNAKGERVPVVTFVTGNIRQEVSYVGGEELKYSSSPFQEAHWYQVYGYTTIPKAAGLELNGESRHFFVEIDNYCDNTDGADYCVDQISFYTDNCKVSVVQAAQKECDEEGSNLNIYVVADDEIDRITASDGFIYWRICDSNGDPLMDKEVYGNEFLVSGDKVPFGKTYVPSSEDVPEDKTSLDENEHYGFFYKMIQGQLRLCFSLANKQFDLTQGSDHYISVYSDEHKVPTDGSNVSGWGQRGDICSVYSGIFIPKRMYVSIAGLTGGSTPPVDAGCPDHVADLVDFHIVLNVPDTNNKETGFSPYPEVHFDFFKGTIEELQEKKYTDTKGVTFSLEYAINYYRNYNGLAEEEIKDSNGNNVWEAKSVYNEDNKGLDPSFGSNTTAIYYPYYLAIKQAIDDKKLYLSYSNILSNLSVKEGSSTVWAISADVRVPDINDPDDESKYHLVCSPLPLNFVINDELQNPEIILGFGDVTYQKNLRVIRVGKKQLDNMQLNNGFLLHIPVNDYKADRDNQENKGTLGITSGTLELLAYNEEIKGTDDISVDNNYHVATFETPVISGDNPYISLNFHGTYPDENDESKVCNVKQYSFKEGFTYRMFFQVKNGAEIDNEKACAANVEFLMKVVPEYVTWNDGSETEEGKVTGTNQNENTNWNNDANWSRSKRAELYKVSVDDEYEDNYYKIDENNTKVVIATPRSFVPMKFTYVTIPSGNKAPRLVQFTKTSDNVGIIDSTSIDGIMVDGKYHLATDSIEYDMMVMIDGETKCEHGGSNVYDLEKYYGNVCKEIYFKPGAELVHQQFLEYKKAWVEKKLTANRWYLMSTPLQYTYAGDMYVPKDNGQQTTEAFQPITFNTTTYSRTAYPIYQRSWGKESKVYTSTNDAFRSPYSASLGYTTWSGEVTEWGHTFNDVSVNYTEMTGFSIRAHKKDNAPYALIRLPKEDNSYYYYDYSGTTPDRSVSVSKSTTGQLLETAGDDATFTLDISNAQQMGGYILVGNPYMASLRMDKFFEKNPHLEETYYTYEESKVGAYTNEPSKVIRPLQAFFVKKQDGETINTITFTSEMMIDGNNPPQGFSAPALTLTASNGRGQSSATLSVGEEARSVETLFDSNLEDVPMVYTVADGQAVSIHQLTELDRPIAFGVTCAASDEIVEVTFTDVAQLTTGDVFVVDAVTGSQTAVGEGSVLGIQPNDYGRYFLLAGTTTIGSDRVDVQKGIVVSVRGKEVTITSGEELTQVRALSLSGASVYQDAVHSLTTSFTLSSGVYIIQAENVAGEQQTVKVVVR